MVAGTKFYNPTGFERRDGSKAFVDALLVFYNKTRKISGIIRKDICQSSPAMKYNGTHI